MAKINLTNQQNQEFVSSAVVSLGVLICLMVAVVGIKLWWFKHRLTFERSSTQNVAAEGNTPAVIVPLRNKQQRYKKDRRYSQQIFESVEVHGVFRQKRDDDLEIQPTAQLPPIRIRQISNNKSSLILPPPRTKRRNQVHSTAFEDLEIIAPSLTAASSSDLTPTSEINTKISLTFEEFEKQFKLKEQKSESLQPAAAENEVSEKPMPPLRLNRSSSAMIRPEKAQRYLKSSQSITMPEFQKVKQKKSLNVSRPTEDLTKIDDYYEPKLFETFGERRPIGYIKYEEVDSDLQEQYENELNDWAEKEDYQFADSGIYESFQVVPNLKVLKNYHKKSPDNQTSEFNFNTNSAELNRMQDDGYKMNNFQNNASEFKDLDSVDFKDTKRIFASEHNEVKDPSFKQFVKANINTDIERRSAEFTKCKDTDVEYRSVKDQRPLEFVRDNQSTEEEFIQEHSVKDSIISTEAIDKEIVRKSHSVKEDNKDSQVTDEANKKTTCTTKNINSNTFDSSSFEENFDDQFINWPQYEEKIETPKINVRKYSNLDAEMQISYEETDNNIKEDINESDKQRATGFVEDMPESPEMKDMKEWQESFSNTFYKKVRYFMNTETCTNHEGSLQNSDQENHSNVAIKQRRPTGFSRNGNNYSVDYTDDSDEDNEKSLTFNQRNLNESVLPCKAVDDGSDGLKEDNEKIILNIRSPKEPVKTLNKEENCNDIKPQEDSKAQVKFDENTDFKDQQEIWDTKIKQRRPTGYIKKMEMLDLTDKQTDYYNSPTVRFMEVERDFNDNETKSQSLLKERRPTGFIRKEDLSEMGKQANFEMNNEDSETSTQENEALKQRSSIGLKGQEEVTKKVNFYLNPNADEDERNEFGNEKLKQRRPTGVVRRKQLSKVDQSLAPNNPSNDYNYNKDFDDPLWLEMEKDLERDFSQNFEEEFAKIRHSYEVNEADFLEVKNDLQKLPTNNASQPQNNIKPLQSPQEIKITFSDAELAATTSILKENKLKEEEYQPKLRKSKVTFDFNADERLIQAEEYSDNDDDAAYDNSPPSIPPQPMQRVTNINYKTETYSSIPTAISPFGSQISQEENGVEDSWTAIRKYRNLSEEFQNLSTASKQSTVLNIQPKISYRNPMAQLAIERAREVRADMNNFKSRSINDKKSEGLRKKHQKYLNLTSDNHHSTDA